MTMDFFLFIYLTFDICPVVDELSGFIRNHDVLNALSMAQVIQTSCR